MKLAPSTTLSIAAILLVAVVGAYVYTSSGAPSGAAMATQEAAGIGVGHQVTLYKTPTCGCCLGYADALREEGFTVEVVAEQDLRPIKQQHHIPADKESCHTSVIGEYVVEGHVPMAAVERLLTEQPNIAGIGLPSMPSGTPGMPGPKFAPYEIYQLSAAGDASPYMTL